MSESRFFKSSKNCDDNLQLIDYTCTNNSKPKLVLEDLPNEMLIYIIERYLEFKPALALRSVNTNFKALVDDAKIEVKRYTQGYFGGYWETIKIPHYELIWVLGVRRQAENVIEAQRPHRFFKNIASHQPRLNPVTYLGPLIAMCSYPFMLMLSNALESPTLKLIFSLLVLLELGASKFGLAVEKYVRETDYVSSLSREGDDRPLPKIQAMQHRLNNILPKPKFK